jgi:hypothetical protein
MLRWLRILSAGNDGRLKALDLGRHGDFLQHAVNAVADAEFLLERLQVNVGSAQFDGVGKNLVDELDDGSVLGGAFQVGIFIAHLVHHQQRGVFVQRVNGVGADAETRFHLAADGLGRGQDRLDFQPGQGLEGVQALGGEQAAGGHLDHAVEALQGEQFLLEQNAGWKEGKEFAIRINVVERGEIQMIFLGQPAQDMILVQNQFGLALGGLGGKDAGVGHGQLLGFDHAFDQFGRGVIHRRFEFLALVHIGVALTFR